MEFTANSTNITELLVVALGLVTIIVLMQRRYDSNLPLLFYMIALLFQNIMDRQVNEYLMYGGLILALTLRFEFMGRGLTKFIAFCATSALIVISWQMVSDVMAVN